MVVGVGCKCGGRGGGRGSCCHGDDVVLMEVRACLCVFMYACVCVRNRPLMPFIISVVLRNFSS